MLMQLKSIRLSKKVSVNEMVELLGLETKAAYYKKESGTIRVSLEEAKKISDFFKMNIEDIFFDNEVSYTETV